MKSCIQVKKSITPVKDKGKNPSLAGGEIHGAMLVDVKCTKSHQYDVSYGRSN